MCGFPKLHLFSDFSPLWSSAKVIQKVANSVAIFGIRAKRETHFRISLYYLCSCFLHWKVNFNFLSQNLSIEHNVFLNEMVLPRYISWYDKNFFHRNWKNTLSLRYVVSVLQHLFLIFIPYSSILVEIRIEIFTQSSKNETNIAIW